MKHPLFPFQRSLRITPCVLALLAAATAGGFVAEVHAEPRKGPASRVARDLEKVGDFFFKFARKLEQTDLSADREEPEVEIIYEVERSRAPEQPVDPSTGLRLPPGYRPRPDGTYPMPPGATVRVVPAPQQRSVPAPEPRYEEPFVPPTFQENPQPRNLRPQNNNSGNRPAPRSSLSLPPPSSAPGTEQRMPAPLPDAAQRTLPSSSAPRPGSDAEPPAEPSSQPTTATGPAPVAPPFADTVPGKPGFVYPPGVEHDLKNMLDVRDFSPGQKVKDPRTGNVFVVPPK